MRKRVADRFSMIEESATFAVADLVKQLRASGAEVWDLGGGDPDFATSPEVVDAASIAMQEGFTHYVSSRGIPELLDAIAEKLHRDNGLVYEPKTDIIVTPSAKHALFIALMAILDHGDEIIIPTPSWVSYEAIVHLIGGRPVLAELDFADGFRISRELLDGYLSGRTKAILVNSPNNPTGRAITEEEARILVDFAVEHDLFIIADEIYEKILYDGRKHISLGSFPGISERTITINGFSKAYAMTGWRLGYVAGPTDVVGEIFKAQQHTVGCAGSFVQRGGVRALKGSQEVVQEMLREYSNRRKLIVEGLNSLPGINCASPDGAFYVFPEVRGTGLADSVAFTEWLLENTGVAVTPGSAFGPGGEGHVRMSFANSQDVIGSALDRMAEVLSKRESA